KRKRPQREKQECPSWCVGCGFAATGYHYEAPSCTSCKTFFRRTVLNGRVYPPCPNENRKNEPMCICRTCRFDRCVEGGMQPLLINSLKNPETNPVVTNIQRKVNPSEPSTSTGIVDSKLDLVPLSKKVATPSVFECTIDRIIGELLYLEKAHQELRYSPNFDPRPNEYRLDSLLLMPSMLSIKTEFLPSDPSSDNGPPMPVLPEAKKLWPFADLLFSIEYMKTFGFFHNLRKEDKIALCRHVSIMCSQLTLAFFSYEKKSGISFHPDGTVPHGGFVSAEKPHEQLLHHGVIQLLRELEMDKKEYVLVKALVVCNPAIEDLSLSHKVELERERMKFAKSLMSYVIARRGHQRGPAAYSAMMALIDSLTHLMKHHKNFHVFDAARRHVRGDPLKSPTLFTDIFDH
ncbi:hypothetical protein PMAYCL1PPCAC_15476, partial [Pristionchus mayeri]